VMKTLGATTQETANFETSLASKLSDKAGGSLDDAAYSAAKASLDNSKETGLTPDQQRVAVAQAAGAALIARGMSVKEVEEAAREVGKKVLNKSPTLLEIGEGREDKIITKSTENDKAELVGLEAKANVVPNLPLVTAVESFANQNAKVLAEVERRQQDIGLQAMKKTQEDSSAALQLIQSTVTSAAFQDSTEVERLREELAATKASAAKLIEENNKNALDAIANVQATALAKTGPESTAEKVETQEVTSTTLEAAVAKDKALAKAAVQQWHADATALAADAKAVTQKSKAAADETKKAVVEHDAKIAGAEANEKKVQLVTDHTMAVLTAITNAPQAAL